MKSFILSMVAFLLVIQHNHAQNYDLTPQHIKINPSPTYVGDKVVFIIGIKNQGKDTIPEKAYEWEFYVDNKLLNFDRSTGSLSGHSDTEYSMSDGYWAFTATNAGTHSYRMVLDPDNRLAETNESNNVVSGTFEVLTNPPPDRVVDSIALRARMINCKSTADAIRQAGSLVMTIFPKRVDIPKPLRTYESRDYFIIRYPPLVEGRPNKPKNPYSEIRVYKKDARLEADLTPLENN